MTIGEKIKHYRLEKNMTQERLAAELNLSFQAISKWEREESLPDITIISRLSQILGISCDALLTDHLFFPETEVQKTLEQLHSLDDMIYEEYCQKIALLEKALEKYPCSIKLMAALADIYSKGPEYPEYTANDYLHRAIELYRYIIEKTNDSKLKYQSIQMLCYLYREDKKYDLIKDLAENMPEIYQSRPALLYHSMPDSQVKEGIRDYVNQLIDTTEAMMKVLLYPEFSDTEECNEIKMLRMLINRKL